MYRLLASENGFVHVCGHRGHSIGAPENTLAALRATRQNGGTSAEIDCQLTADGEIVLMHDETLDRTTDGTGLVSKATMSEIRALDAGSWFDARFARERVPTLAETLRLAREIDLALVIEIKEFQQVERLMNRLGEIVAETGGADDAIFISFDHTVLVALKKRFPELRTEGIPHARHADIVAVARSAELDSVSIELDMFQPEDGEALHRAGVAVRVHLHRPQYYARFASLGLDLLAGLRTALAEGKIDTVSGDDVAFLASLVAESAPADTVAA